MGLLSNGGSNRVSRRAWLKGGLGMAGGLAVGALPGGRATAAPQDRPSHQGPDYCDGCLCPVKLMGFGGGTYLYLCHDCPNQNSSGIMYSPVYIPMSDWGCASSQCVPIPGFPSPQGPAFAPAAGSIATAAGGTTNRPIVFARNEEGIPFDQYGVKPENLGDAGFWYNHYPPYTSVPHNWNYKVNLGTDADPHWIWVRLVKVLAWDPKPSAAPLIRVDLGVQIEQPADVWPEAELVKVTGKVALIRHKGLGDVHTVMLAH